jgi:hypothetical protein
VREFIGKFWASLCCWKFISGIYWCCHLNILHKLFCAILDSIVGHDLGWEIEERSDSQARKQCRFGVNLISVLSGNNSTPVLPTSSHRGNLRSSRWIKKAVLYGEKPEIADRLSHRGSTS